MKMTLRYLFLSILMTVLCVSATFAERDRVTIKNGSLLTDHGDVLRGCHAHTLKYLVENTWSKQAWWDDLAKNGKMNVVRVMASIDYWKGDCEPMTLAKMKERLDIAVDRSAKAGMYLIIDDHSQCCGSDFKNFDLGKTFWKEIAPRYAHRTHVIYEIKNEPKDAGEDAAKIIQYMKECFKIIRESAPKTHVIVFSHANANENFPTDVINSTKGTDPIDYSNASVGFHGYYNKGDLKYALQIKNSGKAVICTEFDSNYGSGDNASFIKLCEDNKISWVWLFDNRSNSCAPRNYCDCKDETVATSIGDNESQCRINCRQTGFNPSKYKPTWPSDSYATPTNTGVIKKQSTYSTKNYGRLVTLTPGSSANRQLMVNQDQSIEFFNIRGIRISGKNTHCMRIVRFNTN